MSRTSTTGSSRSARVLAAGALLLLQGCLLQKREFDRLTPHATTEATIRRAGYRRGVSVEVEAARVDLWLQSERTGTTFVGPVIPLIPTRFGYPKPASGQKLWLSVSVAAVGGPVTVDPSGIVIRLADGTVMKGACPPSRASNTASLCADTTVAVAPGGIRRLAFVFDIDPYRRERLTIEVGGIMRFGRPVLVPPIVAERRSEWFYGFPPA